jgi:hypothetical protein
MATHAPAAAAPAAEPPTTEPTPATIMQLASGFMAAKHLFAANELGLFQALADSPATPEALAARTGLTRRAARISADAMVALGLLEVQDGTYRNGKAAARFLSGPGPQDLRPFLRFWDKISYPTWTRLAEALASGPSREIFELDDELQQVASAGIEAILAGPATALPQVFDFGRTSGCSTSAAAPAHGRSPSPCATSTSREPSWSCPQRRAGPQPGGRRGARAADHRDHRRRHGRRAPAGYDAFLLANLVHYWSAEQNQELLQRVRRAAQPGSALLLADFWTTPAHTEPLQAALMAASSPSTSAPAMSTAWTRPAAGWTTPDGASSITAPRRPAKPHRRRSGMIAGPRLAGDGLTSGPRPGCSTSFRRCCWMSWGWPAGSPCGGSASTASACGRSRGDLTGANPTDRGKQGSKLHLAGDAGGLPLAVAGPTCVGA